MEIHLMFGQRFHLKIARQKPKEKIQSREDSHPPLDHIRSQVGSLVPWAKGEPEALWGKSPGGEDKVHDRENDFIDHLNASKRRRFRCIHSGRGRRWGKIVRCITKYITLIISSLKDYIFILKLISNERWVETEEVFRNRRSLISKGEKCELDHRAVSIRGAKNRFLKKT
jgi:hypothetical protein